MDNRFQFFLLKKGENIFLAKAISININYDIFSAPVARMIKFYGIPLLTAGGLVFNYNAPKKDKDSQFHLMVKTGISYEHMVNFTYEFFNQ